MENDAALPLPTLKSCEKMKLRFTTASSLPAAISLSADKDSALYRLLPHMPSVLRLSWFPYYVNVHSKME